MSDIETPIFHLEKVVKAKAEDMEDFTGPLDLILSLLAKNKMEIKDIQIAVILDQDEEALSEMEQLIASLEEHQRHENFNRIKAVIPALADRNEVGRDYITKTPELIPTNKAYRYVHKAEDLRRAMLAVLERSDNRLPPPMAAFEGIVGREPYPVADKAGEILRQLIRFGVTRFRALFKGNRSRSEIVATFIAVLELCRARRVRLAGTETDCTVTCTDEAAEDFEFTTDVN